MCPVSSIIRLRAYERLAIMFVLVRIVSVSEIINWSYPVELSPLYTGVDNLITVVKFDG